VYGNTPKEDIQKLFPPDVSPELQKLLTLLLQKFQSEWKNDVLKDQVLYAEHGSPKIPIWLNALNISERHFCVNNLYFVHEYK
jgi:hypothetical protein